jgi:hypothetical protein
MEDLNREFSSFIEERRIQEGTRAYDVAHDAFRAGWVAHGSRYAGLIGLILVFGLILCLTFLRP